MRVILLFAAVLLIAVAPAYAGDSHVIPFNVDPPIQVDGNLDDWANVPNPLILNRHAQVTYTPEVWEGPQDLSGVIRLAWRYGGIFVAAEITDDIVNQPYRARDIWKGDHLNLWVDMTPGQEEERQMFGRGQFHIVLSPGNLGGLTGKEEVAAPELYVYRPEGLKQEGGQIVARRTEKGYLIEAMIPWSRVDMKPPKMHQDANFEVAISEADGAPARQEAFMTSSTEKWVYRRKRMVPVVFGDGNGKGNPPVRAMPVAAKIEVPALMEKTLNFKAQELPEGKDPYIFFRARFHAKSVTGVREKALYVALNGKPLPAKLISNRNPSSRFFAGGVATFVAPDGGLGLYYANGWDRPNYSQRYNLLDVAPHCEYEFNVTGLLKPGENVLAFRGAAPASADNQHTALIGDVELRVKARVVPPPPLKDAPAGPLPVCEPQTKFRRTWSRLKTGDAQLSFRVNGETFAVNSRFSAPDGKWHRGSSPFFKHSRKIVKHDEYIEVRDTFKNISAGHVPIMQEHACEIGEPLRSVWLAGYKLQELTGRKPDPANPSAFGVTDKSGVGMFAHNDTFIVHIEAEADNGAIRLADRQFVLEKDGEYTSSFVILPVPKPDFWTFINQARRARDVNFPLKYTFAFMSQPWPIYYWTDEQFRNFIDNKSADFVVLSNNLARVKGRYPRCTELYSADLKQYYDFFKRFHQLYPKGDVKTGVYYHSFLDTTPANEQRFKADRALDATGKHINYGGKHSYMKVYLPSLDPGSWGDEIGKWVDLIFDDFKADGVFWDEFTRSRGSYIYNYWDHCSADIDPKTFRIIRLKGSVPLLSLPFRLYQVRRILGRGAPFVINGAPATRTMVEEKFMAFTETGSITNCRKMLLHSPVALGDHLTERTEEDAYRVMLRALDHGCLYSWYAVRIFPTHKTLTEHMFPSTPIELHEGYIIARERIVTNRSGLFGWGDDSDFEVYVYDREGRKTDELNVPKIARKGKTFAEVRIPEGYSAAIVRKK